MRTIAKIFSMAVCIAATLPPSDVLAYKLHTLHTFCDYASCPDGAAPIGGLVADANGNLYGTTSGGGGSGKGMIFELIANETRTKWKYRVIHKFCQLPDCEDGAIPYASLIVDAQGNLYGTTIGGGPSNGGTVFELMPNARHNKWKFVVRYAFCATSGCSDGIAPFAALSYFGEASGVPYDGVSPLYGTTSGEGEGGIGNVFMLTHKKWRWSEQVLYTFCKLSNCADGSLPFSGVIVDQVGNLYGTTFGGGASGVWGVVYELAPGQGGFKSGSVSETVLYSFCPVADQCTDGGFPMSDLVIDAAGNLYGTTFGGGNPDGGDCVAQGRSGCGVIFEVVPNGPTSREMVLYRFCSQKDCIDGGHPSTGLVMDQVGALYGVTRHGGRNGPLGSGTVFKYDITEKVLYRFCYKADCADGDEPLGKPIMDGAGNLFGTAWTGGAGNGGTVFELTTE